MKKISLILCLALLLSALTGCGGRKAASGAGEFAQDDPLLRTDFVCEDNCCVFYEIFVGSFSDSNGDGTGDLRGIIRRMDYLNDGKPDSGLSLGVEGIWLTPVFRSPSYHKYDVTDYYAVDPDFGTMEDLRELFALCRERNVKVIISDDPVASPIVYEADVVVAMNLPSLDKFEHEVKPGGLLVINSSIIERKSVRDDITVVYCDAMKIAEEVKNPKGANVAILGAMLAKCPIVDIDKMTEAIRIELGERKAKFLDGNVRALKAGMEAAQ